MGTDLLNVSPEVVELLGKPELTFFVPPLEDLDAWWEGGVRKAVLRVKEKTDPRWSDAKVYHWIANRQAHLMLTCCGSDLVGVTVLCGDGDAMAVRTDALVIVAWSDPKNMERGISEDVLTFTQARIEDFARHLGFRTLRMHTPRAGWLGRVGNNRRPGPAIRLGYELTGYSFKKVL